MISWGTNYYRVSEVESPEEEECKICSKRTRARFSLDQGVFSLYGLNLFPSSKKYFKTCPECNAQLKAKNSDANFKKVKQRMVSKFRFKYVWGWIIMGPILAGIIYFFIWVQSIKS